jgi:hypothetical protein
MIGIQEITFALLICSQAIQAKSMTCKIIIAFFVQIWLT